MSKHKPVNIMLKSNNLSAEDIANYAVMNSSDRDIDKTRNIEDLINRAIDIELRKSGDVISKYDATLTRTIEVLKTIEAPGITGTVTGLLVAREKLKQL